jgi:heterotetrameric sarcosine oxidase delta subunit
MKLIPCPLCGPRNASDFRYVGESRPRPEPETASRADWRANLYLRENPAGWITETWYCRSGCRRYFVLERNTVTGAIRSSRLPAAQLRRANES